MVPIKRAVYEASKSQSFEVSIFSVGGDIVPSPTWIGSNDLNTAVIILWSSEYWMSSMIIGSAVALTIMHTIALIRGK